MPRQVDGDAIPSFAVGKSLISSESYEKLAAACGGYMGSAVGIDAFCGGHTRPAEADRSEASSAGSILAFGPSTFCPEHTEHYYLDARSLIRPCPQFLILSG